MLELNMKDARQNFRDLLDRVEHGEEVLILRRGAAVARIVPVEKERGRLPRLADFRRSIGLKGTPSADLIREEREKG